MRGRVKTLGVLVVALLVAKVLCAQDAVALRYAWRAGNQLAWTMSMKITGVGSVRTPQGIEPLALNAVVSMPLFLDVLDVSPEGLATIRLSVGLIVTEVQMPDGGVMRAETDLQAGKVTTRVGGAERVAELPEAARGPLANSLQLVLDDRGLIREVQLPQELRAALSRVMPGLPGGAGDLAQWASWLEPPLPEEPMVAGASWQTSMPIALLLDNPDAPKVVTTYRYEGRAEVEGIACHKITAHSEIRDLTLTLPPEMAWGLETRIEGLSVFTDMTAYLSAVDTHLLRLEGTATQSGTIHQKGLVTQADKQIPVDQTIRLDKMEIVFQVTRG